MGWEGAKPVLHRLGAVRNKIAIGANIKSEMGSFKRNENIHKKEGGSYYVVSANKASSINPVTASEFSGKCQDSSVTSRHIY